MDKIIMFSILAVIILGSALMCVLTKRIMRAATFLLFVLFGVAGLYFLLGYTFLGAAQISVYAGGITVMYIFAIQLVSKRALQGLEERFERKRVISGLLISLLGIITVGIVFVKNSFISQKIQGNIEELPMHQIGVTLLGADKYQYVLPFEFISVFLLACIVGGILIARKEDNL